MFLFYLLPLLAAPVGLGLFFKFYLKRTITWAEAAANFLLVVVICTITLGVSFYRQTTDVEIWNGVVTHKERTHGHYKRPYDCMCYDSCSGSGESRSCTRVCQTCYEDRYTVEWWANTTVGKIVFQSLDRDSRSVYNTPDPKPYVECKVGEPASAEKTYRNYLIASPDSLFNRKGMNSIYKIPSYPRVHSFYKINRVLDVDSGVAGGQLKELNRLLSESLISLGSMKQVNAIVIVTNILDPSYRHDVENAWLGGKKNDVVMFLGMNGDRIEWADVMTWALNSGNERFHVTLRDRLLEIGVFEPEAIATAFRETTVQLFDRPQMKDFEYLKNEIEPRWGALIFCWMVSVFGTLGLTYYFHRNDITS